MRGVKTGSYDRAIEGGFSVQARGAAEANQSAYYWLQKVSAQIEASRLPPQVVLNNP